LGFLDPLRTQYAHQPVFLQAVEEMATSLRDAGIFDDPGQGEFYRRAFVAMTEPERTLAFRVPWTDDAGDLRFNRGWRVEFNRCVRGRRCKSNPEVRALSSRERPCALILIRLCVFSYIQCSGALQGGLAVPPERRRGCAQVLGI
jgi:hypothetical protein